MLGTAALVTAPAASAEIVSSSFAPLSGAGGCVQQLVTTSTSTPAATTCASAAGLIGAEAVAVAPDDKDVYVASDDTGEHGSNAILSFRRDAATGKLTPTGCTSDDGGDGRKGSDGLCTDGDGLAGADGIAISPDGTNVYVAARASGALAAFARDADTGKLTQIGCHKAYPEADHCLQSTAMRDPEGVTITPDGLSVYVASARDDAVTEFTRDPETGKLDRVGCVSNTGSDGACVNGDALDGASAVTSSPDGKQIYVTAQTGQGIAVLNRDADTGTLTPAGCFMVDPPAGGPCKAVAGLSDASDLAFSGDGKSLYVASPSGSSLSIFSRNADTGALTAQGCLTNAAATGDDDPNADDQSDDSGDDDSGDDDQGDDDGDDPGDDDDERRAADVCDGVRALSGISDVVVSADGHSVFATGYGSLVAFDRNTDNGALKEVGCAESNPSYKSCVQADNAGGGLAVSSDGKSLYTTSGNAVGVFGATVAVTTRRASVTRAGVARVSLACPRARRHGCTTRLKIAGRVGHKITVARGRRRTVRVHVSSQLQRHLRAHRHARVLVRAFDARHVTRAAGWGVVFR